VGAPSPRAKKKIRLNLQGKFVSAPPPSTPSAPQAEQETIFRTFFAVWGKFGASISSFRPSLKGVD